ncbi:hypothetical protein CDAR_256911 [Caerostris darwini]|uniref:Uncharacterized protein n=1 Tax=Caerostris darwini TaxID=1538125 RepID=A0AAV4PW28_9ARAC|nr:hypothetical protein CDAR_256911 [Caerostris darwini]
MMVGREMEQQQEGPKNFNKSERGPPCRVPSLPCGWRGGVRSGDLWRMSYTLPLKTMTNGAHLSEGMGCPNTKSLMKVKSVTNSHYSVKAALTIQMANLSISAPYQKRCSYFLSNASEPDSAAIRRDSEMGSSGIALYAKWESVAARRRINRSRDFLLISYQTYPTLPVLLWL